MPRAAPQNDHSTSEKINDNPSTISISSPVSSTTNLTGFGEIAPTSVSSSEPIPRSPFARPNAGYDARPIPDALKNNFRVATFDWGSATPIGGVPYSISFPIALFNIPNIAMKLTEYRYFAADVKMRVKINATPFHFGSLGVVFVPRCGHAVTDKTHPFQLMSHPGAMFLEPGGQESLEMELHRLPITPFDPIEGATHEIGTVFFIVRAPLAQLSGEEPAPISVSIFANLTNIELAGYGETDASAKLIRHLVKGLTAKNDVPKKQSGKGKAEAQVKSQAGVISSLLDTASSFAPVLAVSPLAEFAPFAAIAGAAAPFFKSIGLSKPASVKDITPTSQSARRYMAKGSGLTIHERLGLHQDASNAMPNHPLLTQPDIRELIKMPAWLRTFSFDETATSETVLRVIPLTPSLAFTDNNYWYPGMLAYYSQFFQYWRGGFKVMIVFNTAQYTTATLRITHNSYYEPTPSIESSAGNRISEVLEIRGNTTWKKSFPFLYPAAWAPIVGLRDPALLTIDPSIFMSSLQITVVNPAVSTPDVDHAKIYYSVYIAADDDFDFKDYTGYLLRTQVNEIVTPPKKQSLMQSFSTKFQPIHPALASYEQGWVKSETETNLMELGHIECECAFAYVSANPNRPDVIYSGPSYITKLLEPFRVVRGGVNIRYMGEEPAYGVLSYAYAAASPYAPSAGMAGVDTYLTKPPYRVWKEAVIGNQDICLTVPYKSDNPFALHDSTLPQDVEKMPPVVLLDAGDPSVCLHSLADDFAVGLPTIPHRITYYDPGVFKDPKSTAGEELRSLMKSLPSDIVRGVTSSSNKLAQPKL